MRPISRTGSQTGFTLMELVLAMTLGGMVLTAVYNTFSVGVDTQRRIARVASRTQAWRFFAERLRADVQNLLVEEQTLIGEQETLTLSLGGSKEVHYERRDTADGGQIRRIIRSGDDEAVSETVVFEGAEQLTFRYFDDGKWRDKSDEGLPRAVECSVRGGEAERTVVVAVEVDDSED